METKIKDEQDKQIRMVCLDKAINIFGTNRYTAGGADVGNPDNIIKTAKKFCDYIEKGE
jgi:hypothetical protein